MASVSSKTKKDPPEPVIEQAGVACTVVFVVDKHNQPLMPCHPARARKFLKSKRADVFCMHPFTIRLLDREGGEVQEVEMKFDPGSKVTGAALMVKGALRGWFGVAAWELHHRGQAIRNSLLSRAQSRRGRRSRKTRYRAARFLNRTKPQGWLPPSLQSRVENVVALMAKLQRVSPLTSLAVEQVRFDTQLLENPNLQGVEYQQGTLAGYEVKEYLLLKWGHACAYCPAENVPLEIDHIVPKSRGGTNRISNLCLACHACNQKKGAQPVEVFLKNKPDLLKKILKQARAPLKDAAAVNTTRLALVEALQVFNLAVTTGSGGHTKFNRTTQGYAKQHWIDAACVGETGAKVCLKKIQQVTVIQAKGRGSRQMCKPDKFGFPRTAAKTVKRFHGFQTGDRVRLVQPSGKYAGTHEGIVSIRATGMFDIKVETQKITAKHDRFTLLARFDGYTYARRAA